MSTMKGRIVLVTGAASGIGRATAECLAGSGANVAMLDLDGTRLEEAAAAIGTGSADHPLAAVADVSDQDSVDAAVASALTHFGRIDGVVTCAGIFEPEDMADIEQVELSTFDKVIGVNLRGTFLTLRAALPHLGSGASVVMVASTAGLRGHGFGPAYTASKGGVLALTRLAAVQYGPRGIRVNCVCPGATAGEGMGAAFADPARAQAVSRDLPLRRVGQATELGATIAALLSEETSYLTGQVIAVDGGATVR